MSNNNFLFIWKIENFFLPLYQLSKTIKNNKTMVTDMIIWFEATHGSKYYIHKGFFPIRIKKGETTLDEIKEKAQRYTEKGYKRIFTLLHKRYPNEISVCHAESISRLEKFSAYEDILLK